MEKVCKESGKVFISPYDHPDVIAGQVRTDLSNFVLSNGCKL